MGSRVGGCRDTRYSKVIRRQGLQTGLKGKININGGIDAMHEMK